MLFPSRVPHSINNLDEASELFFLAVVSVTSSVSALVQFTGWLEEYPLSHLSKFQATYTKVYDGWDNGYSSSHPVNSTKALTELVTLTTARKNSSLASSKLLIECGTLEGKSIATFMPAVRFHHCYLIIFVVIFDGNCRSFLKLIVNMFIGFFRCFWCKNLMRFYEVYMTISNQCS